MNRHASALHEAETEAAAEADSRRREEGGDEGETVRGPPRIIPRFLFFEPPFPASEEVLEQFDEVDEDLDLRVRVLVVIDLVDMERDVPAPPPDTVGPPAIAPPLWITDCLVSPVTEVVLPSEDEDEQCRSLSSFGLEEEGDV